MPFTREPRVYLLEDGVTFRLADDVDYVGGRGDVWTIPRGFETDLATIPAVVSWAIPKLGAYSRAAIVHDLLCVDLADHYAGRRELDGDEVLILAGPRDTDAIFRRIMREGGVDVVTRWLVWTGVRWGALANPARRAGWLRDAPAVLALSLLALPVLLPATVLAVAGRLVLRAASAAARLVSRRSPS